MRAVIAAAIVVLGAGLTAGSAQAARPATPAELDAMAAGARIERSCLVRTRVSTVDERWATTAIAVDDDCPAGDGLLILQVGDGAFGPGWYVEMSVPVDPTYPCPLDGVPTPAAADLTLCRPVSDRSYVLSGGELRRKPRRLVGPGTHTIFDRLRWRGWDTNRAVGIGRLRYTDTANPELEFTARIRLVLSARRVCDGRRTFSRLQVRGRSVADRRKVTYIAGRHTLLCP